MAGQGPGTIWASGPIPQVGNRNTVEVLQGVRLGLQASLLKVPGRAVWGPQQEWVALGMVLVGLVA